MELLLLLFRVRLFKLELGDFERRRAEEDGPPPPTPNFLRSFVARLGFLGLCNSVELLNEMDVVGIKGDCC